MSISFVNKKGEEKAKERQFQEPAFTPILPSDWVLDQFQPDDPVSPCRHLHPGRSLPDDRVGSREAQELQERVDGRLHSRG